MPRTARILLDNSYYHIITRGIDRRKLFYDNQDYEYRLKVIKRYLDKFPLKITNYCLMPNHIHLLVYLGDSSYLSKFMQATLQVYAAYFRFKYNTVGFIFQNRYKSPLIQNETYLLECARYIERNPLRAGLTKNLSDYPWSSFHLYADNTPDKIINLINPLFTELEKDRQECAKKYIEYVTQDRAYETLIDQQFNIGKI